MPEQLQISEPVATRTRETEVVRNVGIPERLPPAERVVSVNARVEITDTTAETDTVVYSGVIRTTIFYASADDPADVISIRRNFSFTERASLPGARPGYDVTIEAGISDIDFYVINERLLGVEYTVTAEIEVTAPERISFIEEREDIRLRRRDLRIRRELRERNYSRQFSSVVRLPSDRPDINRIVNVDSDIRIIDIIAGNGQVTVNGTVTNEVLYLTDDGVIEYTSLDFSFSETLSFRGVTPDMTPFVEAVIRNEEVTRVDDRRMRKTVDASFRVLVVREEEVSIPTEIVSPEDVFPVTRRVLVDRIVAEERTRILVSDRVTVPEGNPDIRRIIRATGRIVGGSVTSEAGSGGVIIEGEADVNILYVADLPDQPVYFTSAIIPFSYFLDIAGVNPGMDVYAEVSVRSTSASRINDREFRVRVTLEVNVIVTEKVRVTVVVGISETPEEEEEAPAGFITYTIRSGDTLYLIAQRYGVSVNRLIEINNIADPGNIQIGQQIRIPTG